MRKWITSLCAAGLLAVGMQCMAAAAVSETTAPVQNATGTAESGSVRKTRGTLVFVPLDTRPVSKDYPVETMRAAGWEVQVPPVELLSSNNRTGKPDQLFEWLETKARESIGVVVSADALIYGGLVDSRTHYYDDVILRSRAERLLGLKKKSGNPNVYVFVTIMRSPKASAAPVEPIYYQEWGSRLFRQGALRDKAELRGLNRKEKRELQELNRTIPRNLENDFYGRRKLNFKTTELLLHGVESGSFNYLLIGRDDTAPLSQAHKEARQMSTLVNELPKEKIRFFSGADQLGLLLLTQAANRLLYTIPLVYADYAPGKGGDTIPTYEDDKVSVSAREHIFASGGYPVRTPTNADYILAVNTPYTGVMKEASDAANNGVIGEHTEAFLDKIQAYLDRGKKVIVSDSAYGNGADNALVKGLFQRGLAYKVAAYGGWNTSGNALGFALAQGLESPYYRAGAADDLLNIRYLDDWAYQANARMMVYKNLIWPNHMPNSGFTEEQKAQVEKAVSEAILQVAQPLMGEVAKTYDFKLPWDRMFEVEPVKKRTGTEIPQ